MTIREINNFFGDMDLYLIDQILKGNIPNEGTVLDIGCGDGRNGIYFLQNHFTYHGWDMDKSALQLLRHFSRSLKNTNAHFLETNFLHADFKDPLDLIICSRVLHFADSEEVFFDMWEKIKSFTSQGTIVYISMDSAVDSTLGKTLENGQVEFPDSKVRFALTGSLYESIKKGFEEIEPLRTLSHYQERAQSFILLRRS